MVFTSKTLIPGKTPIGQNKDGSYIYDGIQSVPNMSFMPAKNTFDASKQMSVTPKPIYTPPTPLPMTKSPLGFNIMPQVNKKVAQKVNAPVKDTLNFRTKIKEDSPRVQQLRQHFRALEQKGEFQLNDKQTEYIRKFKAKYPDYANVPDVSLYSKIILAEPKAMEQYGNIGQKGIIESIVGLPLAMAKTGSDAIMEAQDVFQERQKTLNKSGNLGLTNLLASASAGRALGTGVLGMAGDVLNVASPLINPETGVTSVTEGLTRDLGTMVEKVPEEYRQQISDLITKYPKITATLGTAFDLSNLIPFLGALGKAKSTSQVDDIIKTVKARPATRFRGEVSPTAFEAGMNRNLISDVAQIPVKTTKATLKGTAKAGEFTGETAIATGVGISKPSQQAIKEAPELYKQARTGALTRETATEEVVSTLKKRLGELSDTGKEYNTIRQSTVTMPKQDFGKILDDFFKENDISKIDMPIKDRKVVQQAIDYIAEYDDILSAKNGLSLRRKLDDLADWSEATGEGKRLIRKLRGKVDEYLGGKIPGLKELDAKYAPEVSFLKKVKSGILNADGSIKDSAISYVANIVGKGKEMKLDRLEELLPGIGQKVRALKAFEEVQAISSIKTGSIMRQLSGVALGNTVVPGFGAIAGFIATNPNIVAFALEKYGMAKKAIKELLKKGAKITSDEAVKVKQAVDAVPSKEVSTFLLGAGEQRKLLMPPKQGDSIIKQLGGGDTPTPSSSLPSQTSEVSSIQKLLQEPQKPQKTPGKSSVLNQLSKGKEKSAGKKVNNPIIQKLAKKQETPKTPQVDTELASLQKLQESLPGLPKVEVPADYKPTDGLPTGTEFESTILPTKTKSNKIPSPDVKRPQIRGIDLGIRSNMIDSLKQEGIFTDSFFAITDKNLSKKFIDYAEQKAIKKGISTSGKEVSMSRLLDTAKKSADTLLVPKEYAKGLDGDKGTYLIFDISDGNKVAINSSYADIFFKNFDDVTFKGSNEVSPVVVLSKGEPVGVIMPVKDPYIYKEKLGDFTVGNTKTPQVEANDFYKERLAINRKKLEDTNKRLQELNDSTDTTLQGQRNNFAEKRTLEIDKKILEDSIKNFEETLGKSPQVEGKTVQPKITDMYEKSGMSPEMAKIARNLDESFGLDVSKSDYIDEYVSQKLGKKFRYSSDLAGRYSPEIETAIKEARDIYTKFRAKQSLPLSSKSEVKYSEYNPPTKAKISNIFKKNGFTLSETRKGRRGTEYTGGVKIDVIKKDVKYGKDWVEEPTGKVKITSQKKYHVTGSQEVHSLDSVKEFLDKQGIKYIDNGESLKVDLLTIQSEVKYSKPDLVSEASWKGLQEKNPDLFNTGILRRSQKPMNAKGVIPEDVHSAQSKWHNLGQNAEVPAKTIYKRVDSGAFKGEYEDMLGNPIRNSDGSILQDVYDDASGQYIEPMVSNKELKDYLLESFSTKEGKKYLDEVISALPKDKNGLITAYRIGNIGDTVQSYTLSEGMAKTFSHQGTDIPLPGTPYLPAKGYKDFGPMQTNVVKIDPKGIRAWSPYDAEILVEGKYVNKANKSSLPMSAKSEVKYSEPDNLAQEAKKYKSAEEFIKNVDVGGFVIDSSKIDKMAKSGVKNFKASEILSERGIKEMKDLGLDDADISFIDDLKPTTFAGAVHHGGSAPPYVGIRNPIGIEKSNIAKWLKDNKKPGQSIEDFYSQKLDSTILQELTHIRQLQLGRVDIEKIGKYNAPVEKPYLDYKNQKHEMTADKSEDFRYKRILTDIYNSSK